MQQHPAFHGTWGAARGAGSLSANVSGQTFRLPKPYGPLPWVPAPWDRAMLNHNARLLCALLWTLPIGLSSCEDPTQGAVSESPPGEHISPRSSPGIEVLNGTPGSPFYADLGTLVFGKVMQHTFTLRNKEDVPITIKRTIPACSCSRVHSIVTRPDQGEAVQGRLDRTDNILTVQPGEIFDVNISVDPGQVKEGPEKLAILRMTTDSKVQSYITFEIYFKTLRLFYQANPNVDLGNIPVGGGTGATLQIHSRPIDHQARLIEVVETSPGLTAFLEPISNLEANWNLSVTCEGQTKKGPLRGHVILSHSDPFGEGNEGRLRIQVVGTVVDAVMLYPLASLPLGQVSSKLGKTQKASVQGLAPGHHIQLKEAKISGPSAPYLELETERIGEDTFGRAQRIEFLVHAKKGIPEGPIDALLTVVLDDAQVKDPITRKISGTVIP